MPMSVVYTNFGGELVHENRGGVETTYISDPLGSVIDCRNSAGTQVFSATYWPYGEIRTSTGTNPSQFDFVGALGYYRENANRAYVRARVLRKELGRWMTIDQLWPWESAFGYVHQSPATTSDKSGNQVIDPRGQYEAGWRRWFDDIKPKPGDPGDLPKACAPILGFVMPCYGCGLGLYGQWGNDHPIHICNARYSHCMLCCAVTACFEGGDACALSMQALQMGTGGRANDPVDRQIDRALPCMFGVVAGRGLRGKGGRARHAGCHSACASKYPLDSCPPSSRQGYPYSDMQEVCSSCA
ncbi:MAG TPA: hypothetical protein PKA27_16570 [Fimbriimonadaceae bacterium]|nr:hypothetical protein [Fimbriimonadaceae bacterium]